MHREAHGGGWNARERSKRKKKAGNLAPWIRTHKSSILHVSMAPGNNVRYAIFFPSFFLCVSTLASLFSLFHLCAPFFFGFVFATSDTWDMKLREGKRRKETRMSFTTTLFALNCFERSVLGFRRILRQISSRWNFEKFNHRVRDWKMTTGSEALRKFAVSWRLLEEWNLQKFKYCIIL